MMTMMNDIANVYANGMNQTAAWATTHPVMTTVSLMAMTGLAIFVVVEVVKTIKRWNFG